MKCVMRYQGDHTEDLLRCLEVHGCCLRLRTHLLLFEQPSLVSFVCLSAAHQHQSPQSSVTSVAAEAGLSLKTLSGQVPRKNKLKNNV